MATRKPTYIAQPQEPIDFDAAMAALSAQAAQVAAPAEPRGMARAVADTGLSFGRGAVQGVRMLTDLAGADNAVSGGLRSVEDYISSLKSAEAQADERTMAQILRDAEGKGLLDQVVAGFRAFGVAPVQTLAQAVGTSIPTVATALIPGAGPAAVAGRMGAALGIGAGQGAGAVKSSIYDEVLQAQLAAGKTPEEAQALAAQAQAYGGPNAGQIALGAGLGAWAGRSGIEAAADRLVRGTTQAAPGIARRVGIGAAAEGVPEALQGGQEKFATNTALANEGFDVDPMAGVVASGTMEALAGAAMGGALGIPRPAMRPGDQLRADKLPEVGPMSRAVNAAVEAAAKKADAGEPLPPALEWNQRYEPEGGFSGQAPLYVFQDGSAATAEEAAAVLSERAALQNIEQWIARSPRPMPPEQAQQLAGMAQERTGNPMSVLPLPDGSGYTVVPQAWVASPVLAGYLEQGEAAYQVERDRQSRIQLIKDEPVSRAPRTRMVDPVQVDAAAPNAVAQFIDGLRRTNTMAARAYVRDYEAGRITDADVLARLLPAEQEDPSARLERAAKQYQPEQGLILETNGRAFLSKTRATRARNIAGAETHEVVPVDGGYVVRPTQGFITDGQADADAQPGALDGAAVPGDRGMAEQRSDPAADAGDAPAAVDRAAAGGDADGVRPGDDPAPADAVTGPAAEPVETTAAAPAGGNVSTPAEPEAPAAPPADADVPTLKKAWSDAVQRGDTVLATQINDRIVAAKGKNAPAPRTEPEAPAEQAPAPAGVAGAAEQLTPALAEQGPEALNADAISSKSTRNKLPADAELLGRITRAQPAGNKLLGSLDAETKSLVLSGVGRLVKNREIFKRIVELVPVEVMNVLAGNRIKADGRADYEAVLKNLAAVELEGSVPVLVDASDTFVRVAASVAAEQVAMPGGAGGLPLARDAAVGAREGDGISAAPSVLASRVAEGIPGRVSVDVRVGPQDGGRAIGTLDSTQVNSPTRVDELGSSSDATNDDPPTVSNTSMANPEKPAARRKRLQAEKGTAKRTLQEQVERPAAPDAVVATAGDPDAKGERKFYVTMVRGDRVARLAGPFDTKEEAEAMKPRAQDEANKADPRSAFDAFGVSGITSESHKPGTLNERLGISAPAAAVAEREAAPAPAAEQEPTPLYASRPLTPASAEAIRAWAATQGFKTTLPAADMHVTVAYSREPVDGALVPADDAPLTVRSGKRSVEPLGDQGAVVLKLESPELQARWREYRKAGASWDYESYTPHVTLTYDGAGVDLAKVKPYAGPIELAGETQEPLNVDKADDYKAAGEDATPQPAAEEAAAPAEAAPATGIAPMPGIPGLSMSLAQSAHRGTSFSPERRGEQEVAGYREALRDAWDRAARVAGKDEAAIARITEVFEDVAAGYNARYAASLGAKSQIVSTMIAGGSNFPVRRMEKRNATARKRAEEASEYLERGIKRLLRAARGPIDNSPESELERVRLNLTQREELQEQMKAANAALRKGDDAALEDLGFTAEQIAELKKPDFAGRTGFPAYRLSNNNAEIARLRERLKSAEERMAAAQAGPVEQEYNGVRMVEDATDDRLRLYFDGKPSDAVREDLKAAAFKWSPKNEAWQRQLTPAAKYAAKQVLDKHFPASQDDTGNVAMLKRGSTAAGSLDLDSARALAAQMAERGMVRLNVVQSVADMPARQRDKVLALDPAGQVRGAYFRQGDSIWMVADNIRGADEFVRIAFHEAFHRGLARTIPEAKAVLREMWRTNQNLRAATAAQMKAHGIGQDEAIEEALAVMAEAGTVRDLKGWGKLMETIRSWVAGFAKALGLEMTWTDDMVLDFVAALTGRGLQGGVHVNTGQGTAAAPAPDAEPAADGPMLARTANALRDTIPEGVQQWMTDRTTSQRGFNRVWHRTVGTQLHKAKINKDFGRVYYAVQDFMKDVSRIATLAADKAPDMLPQIESLGDLARLAPTLASPAAYKQRKADIQAASAALFDGTLRYTRDEEGKAVKVEPDSDELGGIVWTDAELRERGLSDRAVKMYRQSRQAIDQSLENMLAADLYRQASVLPPEMLATTPGELDALLAGMRRAAASENPWQAYTLMRNAIKDRLAELETALDGQPNQHTPDLMARRQELRKLQTSIADKAQRIADLQDAGYAPLMRFGPYAVDAVNADGRRVFFGMYESQAAANKAARNFRGDGLQVTQSIMPQKDFEALQGVSPETALLFAEMLGVEKNEAMQKWLQNAVAEQSALKRHIRRKGIEGFDEDGGRVLAAFVTSNARAASRALHAARMADAVENVQQGDVKDEARALVEYVNNPKEEAQALRGLLFVQYIGGSIASAMVNLTQTLVQTLPYLSQYGGAIKAGARLSSAMKTALADKIADPALAKAVARAEKDGVIKPQEVFQLQAEASRSLGSNLYARSLLAAWGSMFQLAEQFNRRTAFIAAYETARQQGMADPFAFAENAVDETQSVFNKGNRPSWSRGAVGATLFTFKTFTIQYLEFLKRLATAGEPGSPERAQGRKAAALALLTLVMLSGMKGLPFADDADDLIDTVAQGLGYNWTTDAQRDKWLDALLGETFSDLVQHGFSGMPGVPFDVSQRLGMANLLPGTGLLKTSESNKQNQVLEVFGVAGSAVRDATQGQFLPVAIRNLMQGLDIYETGLYRDRRGRNVTEADMVDAVLKGIGLQPSNVARAQREIGRQIQQRSLYQAVKEELTDAMAQARFDGDDDALRNAQQALARWNDSNPEARIIILPQTIRQRLRQMRMSKAERTVANTPRPLRAQTAEALQ